MARNGSAGCKGQGLVEYVLLIALIALIAGLSLDAAGVSLSDVYRDSVATLRGEKSVTTEESSCTQTMHAPREWDALKDKFWKGGIAYENGSYQVCRLCGGTLPGYSGSDYNLALTGIAANNVRKSWNGYGVVFRAEYKKNKLNGYMFEIERKNKNNPVQVYFSKWVKGKQIRPPLAVLDVTSSFNWETPPSILVQVQGNSFVASLDGNEVLRATDGTYVEGGVGVISNSGTEITFNDLTVQENICGEAE